MAEKLQQVAAARTWRPRSGPAPPSPRACTTSPKSSIPSWSSLAPRTGAGVGQVLGRERGAAASEWPRPPAGRGAGGLRRADAQLRTIGVGFDGSPEARAALQAAGAARPGLAMRRSRSSAWLSPHADLTPNPWAFAWGAGAIRDDLDERLRGRLESAAGGSAARRPPLRAAPHRRAGRRAARCRSTRLICWSWARAATVLHAACCSARSPPSSCAGRSCPVLVVPRPAAREPAPWRFGEQAAPA